MPLDQQLQRILDHLMPHGSTGLATAEISELRRIARESRLQPGPQLAVERHAFSGPGGELALRSYRPQPSEGELAGLVFFAGALAIGEVDGDDALCRELALAAGCVVVMVDYRLAPEHPFPAAIDDAYAASCWVHEYADTLGIDHKRLAIGGHSGGAALATAVARLAKERRNPALAFQLLLYPIVDLRSFDTASYREHAASPPLDRAGMIRLARDYVRTDADRADPRCSPLAAKNLIGLPAALVVTAECDPLRDEAEAYAAALRAAHVPVTLSRYPGMVHGFVHLHAQLDAGRKALAECSEALRGALTPPR